MYYNSLIDGWISTAKMISQKPSDSVYPDAGALPNILQPVALFHQHPQCHKWGRAAIQPLAERPPGYSEANLNRFVSIVSARAGPHGAQSNQKDKTRFVIV